MRRTAIILGILSLAGWGCGRNANVTVLEAAVAEDVAAKTPSRAADKFSTKVGQLVCWSNVKASSTPTSVTHVWYHRDRETARVMLRVEASPWRTWSRKTIYPAWTGPWRVDIQNARGEVLRSLSFTVK